MKLRRKKQKLNIRDVSHLCMRLGISIDKLDRICANINKYYKCWDAERKGKIRPIATPTRQLRPIVNRLNTILQELAIPDNIHGGLWKIGFISIAEEILHRFFPGKEKTWEAVKPFPKKRLN